MPELKYIESAVKDVIRILIINQIAKNLSENGYKKIQKFSNCLYVCSEPFYICRLKIFDNLCWKLTYNPLPQKNLPTVTIRGKSITSRFCQRIVQFIDTFYCYNIMRTHLSPRQKSTNIMFLPDPSYEWTTFNGKVDISGYPLDFGYHLTGNMGHISRTRIIYNDHPFLISVPYFRFPSESTTHELERCFFNPRYSIKIAAFVLSFLPPYQEFRNFFTREKGYRVMTFFLTQEMIIIYKNVMTFVVQIKAKRVILCRFSRHGPSSFLINAFLKGGMRVQSKENFYFFSSTATLFREACSIIEKPNFYQLYTRMSLIGLTNFGERNGMFIGETGDGRAILTMSARTATLRSNLFPAMTELSVKLSQTNLTLVSQLEFCYFLIKMSEQKYADTLFSFLHLLPPDEIEWNELKRTIKASKEKVILTLVNKKTQQSCQIIISDKVFTSSDLQRNYNFTDLKKAAARHGTVLTALMRLFK